MARRPRPTVRPSKTSAASTKPVMTSAVKNSPIANAETRAMGHREFHRHLSFDDVLDRFLEDRIPADQRSCDANYTDARKWLPKPEPYCRRSQCHKVNTNEFS